MSPVKNSGWRNCARHEGSTAQRPMDSGERGGRVGCGLSSNTELTITRRGAQPVQVGNRPSRRRFREKYLYIQVISVEATMNDLADHPTVQQWRLARDADQSAPAGDPAPAMLDADWLRQLCLDFGADDAGFVALDDPAIADQLGEIRAALPTAKALVSFVCRMARGNIRNPARSIANVEFHHVNDKVNEVASVLVRHLETLGINATTGAPTGFPMEADRWPGKMWLISHKPVAGAAGLGRLRHHRQVNSTGLCD